MTTPAEDTYVPPTHLTQVTVAKDIDFDKLVTEIRAVAADAQVAVVSDTPPPYSDTNVGVLTVGTYGEGPSLDDLNTVISKHKVSKAAQTPVTPYQPVVTADPAVAQAQQSSSAPTSEGAPA